MSGDGQRSPFHWRCCLLSTLVLSQKNILSTSYNYSKSLSLLSPVLHLRRCRRIHLPIVRPPTPVFQLSRPFTVMVVVSDKYGKEGGSSSCRCRHLCPCWSCLDSASLIIIFDIVGIILKNRSGIWGGGGWGGGEKDTKKGPYRQRTGALSPCPQKSQPEPFR